MCETKVYLCGEGGEKEAKVMEDVVLVQPEGDTILLVNLLGEQKLVRGRVAKIDFLKQALYLNCLEEQEKELEPAQA